MSCALCEGGEDYCEESGGRLVCRSGVLADSCLSVKRRLGMVEETELQAKYVRPSWDEYFLSIAKAVSTRADCSRARHGAVVVKDRRILSTGYNAAAAGGPSCLRGQCPRATSGVESLSSYDTGPGACVALHAEQNALLYTSRREREGGLIYVTGKPCPGCWKLIQASGLEAALYPVDGSFCKVFIGSPYDLLP